MDDSRFDAWTRRRFGVAAGGGLAVLVGLVATENADAKKKRNRRREEKKRCRKKANRTWCRDECVRGTCCPGKRCGGGNDCFCGITTEGKALCFANVAVLCLEGCSSSEDCGGDARCLRLDEPCGAGVTAICMPTCGAVP